MKEIDNGNDTNSYRDANRLRKVLHLVNVLHYAKFDSATVSKLTADQWKLIALCAGQTNEDGSVKMPSEITRGLVVEAMKDAEDVKSRKVNAALARQLVGKIDRKKKK